MISGQVRAWKKTQRVIWLGIFSKVVTGDVQIQTIDVTTTTFKRNDYLVSL